MLHIAIQRVANAMHPGRFDVAKLKAKNILNRSDYDQLRQTLKCDKRVLFSTKRDGDAPVHVIVSHGFDDAAQLIGQPAGRNEGFDGVFSFSNRL